MGHFGFSYIGLLFLLLLFIPNILWAKRKPKGYTDEGESRVLLAFERVGEVLTTACALCFRDFNLRRWMGWSWWLAAAMGCMLLYELWWVRYFRSERTLADFYSGLPGIPLAGATLPVAAFFLLGIYGRVFLLSAAAAILGVGHIGIHARHRRALRNMPPGEAAEQSGAGSRHGGR